uniref:Inorganic phosphate transporter n=1 Tax=Mesocestoides corti TaxID=53468 RepID=A0A5K3FA66_MESCO
MLPEAELLVVVVGFIIALALAFGIGANDVANSFGTSVGSKVLSLRSACILATIFEISGAVLLGGQVSSTIRGGIVKSDLFNETKNGAITLMYGQVASLASSCIWMLVATFFKLPVSGSHSIVGATAGFGLVLFGLNGIHWMEILRIVLSWLASPVLSGIVSSLVFFVLKKTVLTKNQPLEPALYTLPFIYGIIVLINLFSVLSSGLSS